MPVITYQLQLNTRNTLKFLIEMICINSLVYLTEIVMGQGNLPSLYNLRSPRYA